MPASAVIRDDSLLPTSPLSSAKISSAFHHILPSYKPRFPLEKVTNLSVLWRVFHLGPVYLHAFHCHSCLRSCPPTLVTVLVSVEINPVFA